MASKRDQKLAEAARAKERPSQAETRALARVEREEREKIQRECYDAVPQSLIRKWTGWQTKSLHDCERKYGCPIGRDAISCEEVLRWLRNFLTEHGPRCVDKQTSAKERLLEEKLRREKLRRERDEESLVRVDELRGELDRLAGMMRSAMARASRASSAEAVLAEWRESLEEYAKTIPRIGPCGSG